MDVQNQQLEWIRRLEAARVLALNGELTVAEVESVRDLPAALSPYFRSILQNQAALVDAVSISALDDLVGKAVARSDAKRPHSGSQ